MVQAGYVRSIGLCAVDAATLRRAHAVYPIGDLQAEYSLAARGLEDDVLSVCRELSIGVTAFRVLARGLNRKLALVGQLCAIATKLGATMAQVAIAWVCAQGEARTRDRLAESLGAEHVTLSQEQLAAIDLAAPKGERVDAA